MSSPAAQEPPILQGHDLVYLPLIWAGSVDQGAPPPAGDPGEMQATPLPAGGEGTPAPSLTPQPVPSLPAVPPDATLPDAHSGP